MHVTFYTNSSYKKMKSSSDKLVRSMEPRILVVYVYIEQMNIAEMGPYKGDVDESNTDLYLPSELWDIRPSFCASVHREELV